MTTARTWGELAHAAPGLARAGRDLLYQHGPGLAYLATIRPDGGPRLHPVCPVLVGDGLYVFVGNQTPKVHDLRRDGRYALHSFPADEVDDEFFVAGTARPIDHDPARRAQVLEVYLAQGTTTQNDTLFELRIERAMHAAYADRPSWPPDYTTWVAPT